MRGAAQAIVWTQQPQELQKNQDISYSKDASISRDASNGRSASNIMDVITPLMPA